MHSLFIKAQCLIYASVNNAIIGSDHGLSPPSRQTIIWANACVLLIELLGIELGEIKI